MKPVLLLVLVSSIAWADRAPGSIAEGPYDGGLRSAGSISLRRSDGGFQIGAADRFSHGFGKRSSWPAQNDVRLTSAALSSNELLRLIMDTESRLLYSLLRKQQEAIDAKREDDALRRKLSRFF